MINVTIVEDNDTIRNGFKEFINDTNDYKCVAEFSSCEDLLHALPGLHSDIILMDIELPGISGIEGIKEIKKKSGIHKIIILTIYEESENVFEALAAGACGYLEKKTPPSQMVKVLGEVYEGKSYMNTYIARKILSHFTSRKLTGNKPKNGLSKNEFNILNSLTNGKSPKAIANHFNIPVEKIHFHFFNIYEKLHREFEAKKTSFNY